MSAGRAVFTGTDLLRWRYIIKTAYFPLLPIFGKIVPVWCRSPPFCDGDPVGAFGKELASISLKKVL